MVGDYEFKKVEDDDPKRCQGGRGRTGQCHMQAVEGSRYCPSHGGNSALKAANAERVFEYQVQRWVNRIKDASESTNIKDMRAEVGVLKMLIEARLQSAGNQSELLIQAGPVGDLAVKMQKLVKQITEYDIACGNTLDKSQLIQFAETFVVIASKYIKSDDDRLAFSDEIAFAINNPQTRALPVSTPVVFDIDEEEES